MMIEKSAKQRALKNFNINSLPVFYRSQKSWMTTALLKEWFNKQFVPSMKKMNAYQEHFFS